MKQMLLIGWFVWMGSSVFAQFSDDFSDGDFVNGTSWMGDTGFFHIELHELVSSGPVLPSQIYLSTYSTRFSDAEIRFLLQLDFNPSTANQVRVYLGSNNEDLNSNLMGYYLLLGETGVNDTISIYRQDGASSTLVFRGDRPAMRSSTRNRLRVKIIRSVDGLWQVFADPSGGYDLVLNGSFTDNTYTSTQSFGWVCDYSTTSRSTMFHLDDVYIGDVQIDTIAPQIVSISLEKPDVIALLYSEWTDTFSVRDLTHYHLDPSDWAIEGAYCDTLNVKRVYLNLSRELDQGASVNLSINGISDLSGNFMSPQSKMIYRPRQGDLSITEIYFDPDSSRSSLPNSEFVELYNRSAFPIELKSFHFYDEAAYPGQPALLPSYVIEPGDFTILISDEDTLRWPTISKKVPLSSFPSLNNSGDYLRLTDPWDGLLDQVAYTDKWYGDLVKADGGYSLEKKDIAVSCNTSFNWQASKNPLGGTPASLNSLHENFIDTIKPVLKYLGYEHDSILVLHFSEEVSLIDLPTLNPGWGVLDVLPDKDHNLSIYSFRTSLDNDPGHKFTLRIPLVSDCAGNISDPSEVQFSYPLMPQKMQMIINEILFNPMSNSCDFVELFNPTEYTLEIGEITIAECAPGSPAIIDFAHISGRSFLLLPNRFVAFCSDETTIRSTFPLPANAEVYQLTEMPNYPDDAGVVVLKRGDEVIDSLAYSDDWHFPLLDSKEGVSLERLDPRSFTQSSSNWHSAATVVGFATPGYMNSQILPEISTSHLQVEPLVFTPDLDGNTDFVNISMKDDRPGFSLTLRIYDSLGHLVRTLVDSDLTGSSAQYVWDGTNDCRERVSVGPYMLRAELLYPDGEKKHEVCKVIVGAKMN